MLMTVKRNILKLSSRVGLCQHTVVKAAWKCILIWFYDFLFFIMFYDFFFLFLVFIIFVTFLQNRQMMVTALSHCCWPGRRVPQSPDC